MKLNRIIIIMLLSLLLLPIIYAIPPITSVTLGEEALEMKHPENQIFERNQPIEFEFHVFNKSTGYPVYEGISCYFHLYNSSGKHIWEGVDLVPSHTFDYGFNVGGDNFSKNGEYSYIAQCNNSGHGAFVSVGLMITEDGTEENGRGQGALLVMILFLGVTALLIIFALNITQTFFQITLSNLVLYMVSFCFFMGGRLLSVVDSTQTVVIETLYTFYSVFLQIANFALIGATIYWFYYLWKYVAVKEQKRRGLEGENLYGK